jgi:hypothetical protein
MHFQELRENRALSLGMTSLILLCFGWAIVLLQQRIDAQRGTFQKIEEFSYLPSGPYLRVAALEYREVAADILWLQAIQFVGGKDPSGLGYEWFYGVLDRVTDLDPRFTYVYQFGGIVLSVLSDHVELSNAILEKGLQNSPDSWQIPFHLGFNYIYHLHDPLKAARYMEKASNIEGHPSYLPLLTARLYSAGEDPKTALAFLEGMYRTTRDEKVKEALVKRMEKLRLEIGMAASNKPPAK